MFGSKCGPKVWSTLLGIKCAVIIANLIFIYSHSFGCIVLDRPHNLRKLLRGTTYSTLAEAREACLRPLGAGWGPRLVVGSSPWVALWRGSHMAGRKSAGWWELIVGKFWTCFNYVIVKLHIESLSLVIWEYLYSGRFWVPAGLFDAAMIGFASNLPALKWTQGMDLWQAEQRYLLGNRDGPYKKGIPSAQTDHQIPSV